MRTKTVNRNIPENREDMCDRFRVRYRRKTDFDILEVNIRRNRTNEVQTFRFESDELPDKDSIHFTTEVINDKLVVVWKGVCLESRSSKSDPENQSERSISNDTDYAESFSPVFGKNPRVLVLGTIPGKESLRMKEYYANPRNSFWKILYTLKGKQAHMKYEDRIEFLKKMKIALWDVCHKGKRKSSLDSDITDEIPNDLDEFIKTNPSIEIVAFNGQKAEKLYGKYFKRKGHIRYVTLLSTSPANASYTLEDKIADWKSIVV